jgi:hypothetical protein
MFPYILRSRDEGERDFIRLSPDLFRRSGVVTANPLKNPTLTELLFKSTTGITSVKLEILMVMTEEHCLPGCDSI